ncbi:MAG: type II toxin-antitoxin system VapC family toxin [Lachnospiraceae bacterium]|jgi:PIN domain nuclease of toxin-antitoxin system|nr:type II toxin-antitoxin system VapC family toxin [Lachnospiraceae bacterium]
MGTVKYLLDTHTFLWVALDDSKLSDTAKKAISDKNVDIFVSPVTAYEILNKHRTGKLPDYMYVAENFHEVFYKLAANELLISIEHFHYAAKFEWSHRDPFDRMLAAQAKIENMTLITNDPAFNDLLWLSRLW